MIRLFFVGDEFYWNSGSMMSSIYTEDDRLRYDWGKVAVALRAGDSVTIRPATDEELGWAYKKLEAQKKEQA